MIMSLEQATLMAKQLPATTDPTHLLQIYSSLHQAHHQLSSFLSNIQFPFLPPPLPSSAAETSLSSAAADDQGNDLMQLGDDGNDEVGIEENSKTTIENIEGRLRDCFIKNKRPKRRLSPSSVAVAEGRRLCDDGFVGRDKDFDPHGARLRALELVYQFHG
ncbi:hypothetical protein CFOL_v3_35387 [Cephalotus follicularis]|uniref:Uncharacterized protein n=1 Tax=Cephalotus follicularis TaxID=3775 RepID=A0A1Q3DI69_CEPFO|nr:hypothetical protein CFOL_v3_35387 [Cephalotus follicularis]